MSDGDKLRLIADWFDSPTVSIRFPEWDPTNNEVQRDLRAIAGRLDETSKRDTKTEDGPRGSTVV